MHNLSDKNYAAKKNIARRSIVI